LSHCVVSRDRPPSTSTLFPYTTLFRSRDVAGRAEIEPAHPDHRPTEPRIAPVHGPVTDLQGATTEHRRVRRPRSVEVLPDRQPRDRKSTRLNSSHVKISYAVFCLKKKN